MSATAHKLQPQPGHVLLVVESHREGATLAPLIRALLDDQRLTITLVASESAQTDCVSVFERWDMPSLRLPRRLSHSEPRSREQEQRHRLRALFRALGADAVVVQGNGTTANAAALAARDLDRRLICLHADTQPCSGSEATSTARRIADTLLTEQPASAAMTDRRIHQPLSLHGTSRV